MVTVYMQTELEIVYSLLGAELEVGKKWNLIYVVGLV